jgi:hypothetical protein
MSKESSVTHSKEEIYVILFTLSGKANLREGLIDEILADQEKMNTLTNKKI